MSQAEPLFTYKELQAALIASIECTWGGEGVMPSYYAYNASEEGMACLKYFEKIVRKS